MLPVFPWASRHPSCARQLSHFLTFLLLLLPQCLLYPQDELGKGVKGKLGSRRTGAQKGNLVLFSGLLTVRSPTSLQLNAELHTKHSTTWILSHPGHCSFLKYILSPLFLSTFLLGRFPSLSLSLGNNLPRLSGPSYFNDCLDAEAEPLWLAHSCMKAPGHLSSDVHTGPLGLALTSTPPSATPHHPGPPQGMPAQRQYPRVRTPLSHLPNPTASNCHISTFFRWLISSYLYYHFFSSDHP